MDIIKTRVGGKPAIIVASAIDYIIPDPQSAACAVVGLENGNIVCVDEPVDAMIAKYDDYNAGVNARWAAAAGGKKGGKKCSSSLI